MKKFLAILSIALATNAMAYDNNPAEQEDYATCTAFSAAVHRVVNARNSGVSFEDQVTNINQNLRGPVASKMIDLTRVLYEHPQISGADAEAYVFHGCMNGITGHAK